MDKTAQKVNKRLAGLCADHDTKMGNDSDGPCSRSFPSATWQSSPDEKYKKYKAQGIRENVWTDRRWPVISLSVSVFDQVVLAGEKEGL
ncbi:uncharacterized protein SPSK_02870 [Sporothrix schenckii 1099-18]|uniref:Uncharacterized protein n=1 Tax=Sporothrix schenckii 1099-18 TaxID=1397361 RepID=A0A0F2MCN4_SPOSC|nr:uncharacterized protein SPSK_02870 [Sporothrix schenckii 1099-18]KJR86590.1 hypothetical protein SPSK_02870 [Sporothrix schenckii 1099-18]